MAQLWLRDLSVEGMDACNVSLCGLEISKGFFEDWVEDRCNAWEKAGWYPFKCDDIKVTRHGEYSCTVMLKWPKPKVDLGELRNVGIEKPSVSDYPKRAIEFTVLHNSASLDILENKSWFPLRAKNVPSFKFEAVGISGNLFAIWVSERLLAFQKQGWAAAIQAGPHADPDGTWRAIFIFENLTPDTFLPSTATLLSLNTKEQ